MPSPSIPTMSSVLPSTGWPGRSTLDRGSGKQPVDQPLLPTAMVYHVFRVVSHCQFCGHFNIHIASIPLLVPLLSVHPPTLLPPPPPQVVPSYSYVLPNSPNSGFVCTVIRFPSDSPRSLTLLYNYTLSSSYYPLRFWHTLLSCPLLSEVLLRAILHQLWRRPPKPGEMEQMLLLLTSWGVLRSRTFNVYWTCMSTAVQHEHLWHRRLFIHVIAIDLAITAFLPRVT